jgi:hypothetical protein
MQAMSLGGTPAPHSMRTTRCASVASASLPPMAGERWSTSRKTSGGSDGSSGARCAAVTPSSSRPP